MHFNISIPANKEILNLRPAVLPVPQHVYSREYAVVPNLVGLNLSADLLTNAEITSSKNVTVRGTQHLSGNAKQVGPTEAFAMLPYKVLQGTRRRRRVCRNACGLSSFTAR